MIREFTINRGLLEALIEECRAKRLPVRIRSFWFAEENGTEMATVTFEHPTDFDFNAVMSRVINEHYNLKP